MCPYCPSSRPRRRSCTALIVVQRRFRRVRSDSVRDRFKNPHGRRQARADRTALRSGRERIRPDVRHAQRPRRGSLADRGARTLAVVATEAAPPVTTVAFGTSPIDGIGSTFRTTRNRLREGCAPTYLASPKPSMCTSSRWLTRTPYTPSVFAPAFGAELTTVPLTT